MAKQRKAKRRKRETAGWVVMFQRGILYWSEREKLLYAGGAHTLFATRRRAQRAIRQEAKAWPGVDEDYTIVRLEREVPE